MGSATAPRGARADGAEVKAAAKPEPAAQWQALLPISEESREIASRNAGSVGRTSTNRGLEQDPFATDKPKVTLVRAPHLGWRDERRQPMSVLTDRFTERLGGTCSIGVPPHGRPKRRQLSPPIGYADRVNAPSERCAGGRTRTRGRVVAGRDQHRQHQRDTSAHPAAPGPTGGLGAAADARLRRARERVRLLTAPHTGVDDTRWR